MCVCVYVCSINVHLYVCMFQCNSKIPGAISIKRGTYTIQFIKRSRTLWG